MSGGSVAPFVMLRVAGGDTDKLRHMELASSAKNIEAILDLETKLNEIKGPLDHALYKLISTFTDEEVQLSHDTLKIKRNIYNDRLMRIPDRNFQELEIRLSQEIYHLFLQWYQIIHKKESLINNSRSIFEAEVKRANMKLASIMDNSEWRKGMVIANSSYLTAYRKNKEKLWHPHKQYARTSMSYLSRIIAKTSPFSTFTKIGMTAFSPYKGNNDINESKKNNFCIISKSLCSELVFEMAKDKELSAYFNFEKNISIRHEDNIIQLIVSNYTTMNGFSWRQDKLESRNISDEQRMFLQKFERGGRKEIEQIIEHSSLTFSQLIQEQFIKPILPFSRNSEHPLLDLNEYLQKYSSFRVRRIARIAKWIENCLILLAEGNAEQRIRYRNFIINQTSRLFNLVNHSKPESLSTTSLIYENVRYEKNHPSLGEFVKRDLESLSREMRKYIFRTHVYDVLCEHFIEVYGKEGVCTDIEEFLYCFETRKDKTRLIKNALKKDKQRANNIINSKASTCSESLPPPTATIFYQLAANDGIDDILKGNYKLIINQLTSGEGGLLLRFQSLFTEDPVPLKEDVRQWIESMHSNSQVVNFPVNSDYTSLQNNPGVTRKSLRIGGENPTTEVNEDLLLKDLKLIHTKSNNLVFIDKNGRPISPIYLGTVPQFVMSGITSYMLTIMHPWLNAYDVNYNSPFIPNSPPPEKVEFYKRIEKGRVVHRRSRWIIPLFLFPIKERNEDSYSYFIRLKKLQKQYNLPNEGFLAGERSTISFNAKQRKPMYMNFNSYHSLEAAIQTVIEDGLLSVSFTEALPNQETHWLKQENGLSFTSEYMSLIKWPSI